MRIGTIIRKARKVKMEAPTIHHIVFWSIGSHSSIRDFSRKGSGGEKNWALQASPRKIIANSVVR